MQKSIIACGIYYMFWIYILPKWRGYYIHTKVMREDGGTVASHRLVQVPARDILEWDKTHDEAGELRFSENTASVRRAELTESAGGGNEEHGAGDALSGAK